LIDLRGHWSRLIDRLVPEVPAIDRPRARLTVQLMGLGFGFALVMLVALWHIWTQRLVNGGAALAMVALLGFFRATRSQHWTTTLGLVTGLLVFAAGAVCQQPFDPTAAMWLVVVPLIASAVQGTRAAIVWCAVTMAAGAVIFVFGPSLQHLMPVDPDPRVTQNLNFAFVLATTTSIGIAVVRWRGRDLEALAAANRARSALLANVSHEIRTPMNGVLGLTRVLLLGPLDATQREQLELVQRSGELMVALINDLLDLSRDEAGRLELAPVEVSLPELLTDVAGLFRASALEKALALEVRLSPGLPRAVLVDPLRLKQVLINLVGNAVKFTEQGEVTLEVSTSAEPGRLRFEVHDTGPGISDELLPRLFGAFEQADASTTRRHGGSGLGLALCRALVSRLGGELTVSVRSPHGSTFAFSVPRIDGQDVPRAVRPRVDSKPQVLPVLIVDDNPVNLKVACALVQKLGYRTVTATNGREALERIQVEIFHAVLMDCHMPELDGYEATQRIRLLPAPAAAMRVIGLTASAMPDDLEACRRAGMDEVLSKPVSLEALERALRAAVTPGPDRS
jgi:signal transduction histidine kinase/CheY-like chemotaxis protein